MLRTEVLSSPNSLSATKEEWQNLVPSCPTATPFQSWEWQSTWLKHYGRSRLPYLVTVREGRDLVGLMPLLRTRGPWNALRPMGLGPSDYLHPLAMKGFEEDVAMEILQALKTAKGIGLVDLHQIRSDQPLAQLAIEQSEKPAIVQATCLQLDLPATFEGYLATLGKSLRYDVRKLDKEPFKSGRAMIEEATAENVTRLLDIFFEQHKKRWAKRHLPGAFIGRAPAFQHEWARLAVEKGWLRLSVLWLDSQPAGALYATAMGEACYFYQAGFDPAMSTVSPGTLLVAHTIRRAIEEGRARFDFLRGDEPYKRRWKPQREVLNYRFLLPADTILGQSAEAWNAAVGKMEGRVRARFEGRGLF